MSSNSAIANFEDKKYYDILIDMGIERILLEILSKPVARRGGVSFSLIGLPVFANHKPKSIRTSIARLKQKEFVTFEGKHLVTTTKGKQYLKTRNARLQIFPSPFAKNAPKNLLVMFDIPEVRKSEREWFRTQLCRFGYQMIQRSVWLGPSPLPRQFVVYVQSIGLGDTIKTFKVSRQPKALQT